MNYFILQYFDSNCHCLSVISTIMPTRLHAKHTTAISCITNCELLYCFLTQGHQPKLLEILQRSTRCPQPHLNFLDHVRPLDHVFKRCRRQPKIRKVLRMCFVWISCKLCCLVGVCTRWAGAHNKAGAKPLPNVCPALRSSPGCFRMKR